MRSKFLCGLVLMLVSLHAIPSATESGTASTRCKNGSVKYDMCERRCVCDSTGQWRCCRIRRDFARMKFNQRRRYIETILKVSTHPYYSNKYNHLIKVHRDLFDTSIHKKKYFLPWHRDYMLRYENLLRKIDCRFTISYWDWAADEAPWQGLPWGTGENKDSPAGMGPNGTKWTHCVPNGPFRESKWYLTASAGFGCLKRSFNGVPPDVVALSLLLSKQPGEFDDFEYVLRVLFHNNVHCLVNGTMCSHDAANAPEFFLHHAFVDKIWHDWQRKGHVYKNTYFSVDKKYMPGSLHTPAEMIDLQRQPGEVCVFYEEAKGVEYEELKNMTVKDLQKICNRRGMSPLEWSARRLFSGITLDLSKLESARKSLEPKFPCPPLEP